jgi:hypothetical protein
VAKLVAWDEQLSLLERQRREADAVDDKPQRDVPERAPARPESRQATERVDLDVEAI